MSLNVEISRFYLADYTSKNCSTLSVYHAIIFISLFSGIVVFLNEI